MVPSRPPGAYVQQFGRDVRGCGGGDGGQEGSRDHVAEPLVPAGGAIAVPAGQRRAKPAGGFGGQQPDDLLDLQACPVQDRSQLIVVPFVDVHTVLELAGRISRRIRRGQVQPAAGGERGGGVVQAGDALLAGQVLQGG